MLTELSDKAIRKVASLPANLAYQWSRRPKLSASAHCPHEEAPGAAPSSPLLRQHEATIVAGLEQNGVFMTDLESLGLAGGGEAGIMTTGATLGRRLAQRAAMMSGTRPTMIQTGPEDLQAHPTIYQWGLSEVLLRIVEAYLRVPIAYDGLLMFHTPADGREVGTRKWHLDREDRRMVKVGLYLHDVGDADGPFQVLKHRQQDEPASGSFSYTALDTDQLVRKLGRQLTPDDMITCTGKAGTLVFADTAQFYHRGKPATDRDRSALFFSYFTRSPLHPYFCNRSRLSRQQIERMTGGLDSRQQACARWHDYLHWSAKMIPSSRM